MVHIPVDTKRHVRPCAACSSITMHLRLKRDEQPHRKGLRLAVIAPSVQSEGWSVGGIVERKQVKVSLLELVNNACFPTEMEELIFLKYSFSLLQFGTI